MHLRRWSVGGRNSSSQSPPHHVINTPTFIKTFSGVNTDVICNADMSRGQI